MRKNIFILLFIIVLNSCIMDNAEETNYDYAVPIFFNIDIDNKTNLEKTVLFNREKADSDELIAPKQQQKRYTDIVCIDNRWSQIFRGIPTGMHGSSLISLSVGDIQENIGSFRIGCAGKNPTSYGEFISGELAGVKTGIVELKLTINEDGALKIEYSNISDFSL